MFRASKETMSGVLFAIAMSAVACNDTTGPQDRAPAVDEKLCVEELRAVLITSPEKSRILCVGDCVVITWEAQHVCGNFQSQVEVSYDDGRNYEVLGEKSNACSMTWRVGECAGAQVKIRVTVKDVIGNLTQELGFAGFVRGRDSEPPDRSPEVYD